MVVVDARGLGCPKPVIMAEDALAKIDEGTIEVLVDNEASVKNLSRFAAKNGFYSETAKENGYWRTKIVKGYPCEIAEEEAPVGKSKNILVVVGTDILGKDEELGKMLMKAFFESMKAGKDLPHTIFFLNKGVMLTTLDDSTVTILKEIEQSGTTIYSCGTCLKYYGIEDNLRVGQVGGMFVIIEGMKSFNKTVWI